MLHYYSMAFLLLLALAAVKIDGWVSAILLIVAMFITSPVIVFPQKKIKWIVVLSLIALAIFFFPDIEQYREAFEQSLETKPLTPQEIQN